jgi:hypothetical protein
MRVQVHGSKRSHLLLADVIFGCRRVERLLNIPAARGRGPGPITLSGLVEREQIHKRGRVRLRVRAETIDGRESSPWTGHCAAAAEHSSR